MNDVVVFLQDLLETVVFGNGWLALGGFSLVTGATAALRLSRGITV